MIRDRDFPADLRTFERDYELIRELGQGGIAAVYLARRRSTGALVAIKAVRARYIDDQDALKRFAREARTVADLDHPNIVRTLAIEQIGDRAVAIISEFIGGGTLRDRLRARGAFSPEDVERVLCDVGQALGYAHRRGIVHRDVKPENVFLDEHTGRALLADFGIARRIEGDVPITLLGSALGTPQYMSPEQIDGGTIDGRSDIYSLGALGWELLTGRMPWAGESLYGVIYKQKHEELPPITSLRPRVPANLLFAIERALIKDRERRWQSIEELLAQLTYDPAVVENVPTVEFRRPPPESQSLPNAAPERAARPRASAPWTGRRRVLAGLALLVPLAIAGGSLYVVLGGRGVGHSDRDSSDVLTSSAGTVTLDTSRSVTPRPATPVDRPRAETTASAVSNQTVNARPANARPANAGPTNPRPTSARATDSARRDSAAAAGATPSPRCRVASMVDQRACLLAYITVNDVPLQRTYDSLIVELRRVAGVVRRAPDPPSVTRLRVEQRAWIVVRDRECTRSPAPGSVPYWAEPLSKCFAGMSASRADELRAALRRLQAGRR